MATNNSTFAYAIDQTTTRTAPAYSVFGTEVVAARQWENIWLRKSPLLAFIKAGGKNWNKGSDVRGTMMILPVNMADMTTVADGVTDANELTAITPVATDGFSQAAYQISHYRSATWIRASEDRLIDNSRGNFRAGKTQQAMDSMANAIADDLGGTTADARANLVGIQQVIATGNTVGGLAQGTYTDWAAQLATGLGAFTLDLVDARNDAIMARNGTPDLGLFSYTSTNNVWGKLRGSIAPAQWLVNTEFEAKYGFKNIVYMGITCMMDNRISGTSATDGRFYILDSSTWFFRGDETPKLQPVQRLTGTDAQEYVWNQFCSVGCNNPAKNGGGQGVTA